MANENVNKVIYGNDTLIDLTGDSVSPQTLLAGQTAHDRSGSQIVGVATQGHTIIDASGSPVNAESGLQFATMQVTDDSINGKTVVRHVVQLTQAQYDALPTSKLTDNIIYEITDVTSEKIQASDVGYNGSNVASALGLKADKTTISNPNLLDNPWFTVNQRGETTCAANTYGVDRWRPIRMTYTVNADKSLTLVGENVATNIDYLCQRFPKGELDDLIGKTATLSILLSSNEVVSATFTSVTTETIDVGDYQFAFDYGSSSFDLVRVGFKKGSSISTMTIKAVKLELGSISTLAMDTAPNYATELLKCQRHFYRYKQNSTKSLIGIGMASNTNTLTTTILFPVEMRVIPTVTASDPTDFYYAINTRYTDMTEQPTSVTRNGGTGQQVGINYNKTGAFVEGQMYGMAGKGYIDFSADL